MSAYEMIGLAIFAIVVLALALSRDWIVGAIIRHFKERGRED